jgi:hypothetical protein
MAKLIASHDAVGEWRGPGQDDPDAAAVLDLDPGPEDGHQPRVIQRAGPRQADMPGYAAAESAATAQAARAPWDAAARSVRLPYSGITLSDEGGPGERTRTRRSVRVGETAPGWLRPCITVILRAMSRWRGRLPGRLPRRSAARCWWSR